MDMEKILTLRTTHPRLMAVLEALLQKLPILERAVRALPSVRAQVEQESKAVMEELAGSLRPYRGQYETYDRLPSQGRSHESLLGDMQAIQKMEQDRWQQGYVSGAVYHGDAAHIDFLNKVYALYSQMNPLHVDLWPSASKFESEIIAMTANMLGAEAAGGTSDPQAICGTLSSGGTESILLAMKTYRDRARKEQGITAPEMVVPVTAHAAFDKASQYFQIKMRKIPVGADYRADVAAARDAINRNTIVVVGSAPSFPHGVIDPIEELSELARNRGVAFHTDACLGGFVLPWAEKLGYPVPRFDFRLPGVTSISVDTHKFGYAAKGTSVVLYRGWDLRHHQYYTTTDWPGGMYFSPTFAGSRPGALVAACWAAMVAMGEQGYLDATRAIMTAADEIKRGIKAISGLRVLGDPLFVIAFDSPEFDIYRIMDFMAKRHWSLNGLHRPACVHLCVTLRHTQPGVAARFLTDLEDAVRYVRQTPTDQGSLAPIYGMGANLPVRSVVGDLLKRYLDAIYRV